MLLGNQCYFQDVQVINRGIFADVIVNMFPHKWLLNVWLLGCDIHGETGFQNLQNL